MVAGNHQVAVKPDERAPTQSIYIEYLFVMWSLIGLAPPRRRTAIAARGHSLSSSERVASIGGSSDGLVLLALRVQLHKLGQVELRLLEHLCLVHKHVLEWVELGALLCDLLGDGLGQELLKEVLEGGFLGLVHHDLHHLLADVLNLRCFSIAGGLYLLGLAACERNAEQAHEVTIGGLGLHESLDQRMPFLDEGAKLVAGNAESSEVGEALEAFDLLDLELDNSPGEFVLVLLVKVSVGNLEDAAPQAVSRDVLSSGFVARGQSGHSNLENVGCTYVVPLLLEEWVDDLLLLGSLLFEVSWVLSGSHVLKFSSNTQRGGLTPY